MSITPAHRWTGLARDLLMGSDKPCYCLRLVQPQLAMLLRRYCLQLVRQKGMCACISATPVDSLTRYPQPAMKVGLPDHWTAAGTNCWGRGGKRLWPQLLINWIRANAWKIQLWEPADLPPFFTTRWVFPVAQHSTASLACSASPFALKGALLSLQQEPLSLILGSCHSLNSLLRLPRN